VIGIWDKIRVVGRFGCRQLVLSVIFSYLVEVRVFDFFGLDADIGHSLEWGGVVKELHEEWEWCFEDGVLEVAEGFAEGMGAEVAFEVAGEAPGFDEGVDIGDAEGFTFVSWEEEEVVVGGFEG